MAVAEKNKSEATAVNPLNRLDLGSLAGVAYVVACWYAIFLGLPYLWWDVLNLDPGSFVNVILLLCAMLAAGVALWWVGRQAVPNPPHGLRAGIAAGVGLLFITVLIAQGIGIVIERITGDTVVGMVLTVIEAAVLLFFLVIRPYFRPNFRRWLGTFEDQGWFTRVPYKGNQGIKVRRGTTLGILALVACGIYTLLNRNPLIGDWALDLPFVDDYLLVLFPYQLYTLPLFLAVAGLWLSWRVVHYPTFADFLIATEAEMNKVSWASRKNLVQDTIVVLVTVVLLTLFLFVADLFWFKLFSNPWVRVVRVDAASAAVNPENEKPEQ